MQTTRILSGVLAALVCASAAVFAQEQEPLTAQPFDRLAGLAGEWVVLDSEGHPTALHVRYEVVANGHAVVETHFVDTENETVTLYHREEGLVTATQVSARQRPARLVPGAAGSDGALVFRLDEETEEPGRLVATRMTWLDDGRLRLQWTHSGADANAQRTFELRRTASMDQLVADVARLRASLDTLQAQIDRHVKREITVNEKGRPQRRYAEIKTFPLDGGWNLSGTPFRLHLVDQSRRFASTYASGGDAAHTLAHYPFTAGKNCRMRFSLLGGHAYVAVVAESRAPPRKVGDIEGFSIELLEGKYGDPIERIVGGRFEGLPRGVEWDLSRYEGQTLRLYVVDAVSDHYGQIAISEIHITEDAADD